jgi:hypothetical protein
MRLTVAAKALATRDYIRGISGLSAPSNTIPNLYLLLGTIHLFTSVQLV